MKLTRKQLRKLIRESITNIYTFHDKYNIPPGQIPYDDPRMKLHHMLGDEKGEKLLQLLDSDDEASRAQGLSILDALGYESEFGSFDEDEFEHDVRMAAKDHDEERRKNPLRRGPPTVHSFMSNIIGMTIESIENYKRIHLPRLSLGDEAYNEAYNEYDDIETYLTQLKNKNYSPREALDELLNKINQEKETLSKRMLRALKKLMKKMATESLEAGFINRGVAMRYVGPDIQYYPTREEQRKDYPHKRYSSDWYRK